MPVPGYRNAGDDWSPDAKLAVVIETASMSEAELSAYSPSVSLDVQLAISPKFISDWAV
jgi:hypothetical protein